jgi:hypothetical protein
MSAARQAMMRMRMTPIPPEERSGVRVCLRDA